MAKYKRRYNNKNTTISKRWHLLEEELERLESRIAEETPDRGYAPPLNQQVSFRALPLSEATLRGLDGANFTTMTEIQNACIPHALGGRDVLGAARTGSGKTLAFLIPAIEKLCRARYSPQDGPGVIVLSPTRELAVQIFQVLKKIGLHHTLSAGLLVGGKKEFHIEQQHVGQTNILIATPGRLLQHLEQTPNFDTSTIQMLVLDEADRILDMGFREQMIRILEYLPTTQRQTLLFSATQTRKVSDLAALSLHKPEYLGVHDKESTSTPTNLVQSIVVVPLHHKLNMVYSFIKSHLKHKTIVFLASCSQVRFVWQLFCALQPGIPVMALHGKLVQTKRTKIYFDFVQRPHAVLFATDVAARGLDFKEVDWVLQVDAPEDKDMYIHRVGRTARYNRGGKSLLCVTPSEQEEMTRLLQRARVPFKKTNVNPNKTVLVTKRADSLVASNSDLHAFAKKAFKSYVRSIHLMPNKNMFNVNDLPLDDFAASLGLASTPNLRFLNKIENREDVRRTKNVNHKLHKLKEQIKAEKLAKKIEGMGGSHKKRAHEDETTDKTNEEDDLLVVKKRHEWGKHDDIDASGIDVVDGGIHQVSKSRHPKRIRVDGSNLENKRIVFGDDGTEEDPTSLLDIQDSAVASELKETKESLASASENYVESVRQRLSSNIQRDRTEEKERIRELHRKKRLQAKADREEEAEEPMMVTLGGGSYSEQDHEGESSREQGVASSSDESDRSEDDSGSVDVKAQEDLALAMIRKNL